MCARGSVGDNDMRIQRNEIPQRGQFSFRFAFDWTVIPKSPQPMSLRKWRPKDVEPCMRAVEVIQTNRGGVMTKICDGWRISEERYAILGRLNVLIVKQMAMAHVEIAIKCNVVVACSV